MGLTALATKGNYFHVYDFHVKPGSGDKFITQFDTFDYSDSNPMHKSPAQVKDGVLCRDVADPDHFYLIGEWADIEAHKNILKELAALKPEFTALIKDIDKGAFIPKYAKIVSSTPQHLLDKAER